MKKIMLAAVACAVLGLNTAAYFDGGVNAVSGPHGYRGTNINLVIGSDNFAFEPSLVSYTSNALDSTYRTYALRGAWETDKRTIGADAGATPEVNGYSNYFGGADITFSLTPGSGGHSRLAGPGSRGAARGGQGVTRIDVGASLKYTSHTQKAPSVDNKTGQAEASLFAGAKVFMINLSAAYTGYSYGTKNVTPQLFVTGLNFALAALPKSSVNVKLDLPGQPMVTPFVSYTRTQYKDSAKDSSAYLLGAYVDLSMVTANVGYQIFNDGSSTNNFLSIGAGIKF
ncbi:MAG: hypothetical protein NTX59_13895 [Elusimicrobia bacterium]|nr:hypothetical protein [Elusimicrobiota bacterium]